MMFQRAEPEENGFGVTTLTSFLTRSSNVLIPFGLPLRVTITTTESWAIPLYFCLSQSEETSPASTSRLMSPAWEKWTIEAGWPDSTARLWSPEAPNELLNETPLPSDVFLNAGSRPSV